METPEDHLTPTQSFVKRRLDSLWERYKVEYGRLLDYDSRIGWFDKERTESGSKLVIKLKEEPYDPPTN